MIDKENTVPVRDVNVQTPPLPTLVPMASSGRKSSVKKVRFSLDTEVPPERESPIRLNRDMVSDNEDIPNPSRVSVVCRRSSIGASDSPLHFPSQAELVGGNAPVGSPSDSRQSTGSSINDVLSSAISSFGQPIQERVRSIWDTPTSSAKKPSTGAANLGFSDSPATNNRVSRTPGNRFSLTGTPGNAEQKLFGFHVVMESSENVLSKPDGRDSVSSPPIVVPSPEKGEEDPMLLSGASSRIRRLEPMTGGSEVSGKSTTGKRRRRRLSHLEDMESELLNVSSPERVVKIRPEPETTLECLLREAGLDVTLQGPLAAKPTGAQVSVSNSLLANVVAQQEKSLALTSGQAVDWIEDLLAERRELLTKSGDWERRLQQPTTKSGEEIKIAALKGQLLGEQIKYRILENKVENLAQTSIALEGIETGLAMKEEEIVGIIGEAKLLADTVEELTAQCADEFKSKFTTDNEGNVVRIKSDNERRLEELDLFIKQKEEAIRQAIEEIQVIEQAAAEKQREYTEGFSRMRQFYLDNGWNVICQVGGSLVLVYAICHILVFEKARNNENFWKLVRIVPAKLDPAMPPFYAPYLLSPHVRFNARQVLDQLVQANGLNVAFEYDPMILHELMGAAVTALCEFVDMRNTLARCLPSNESRVKINSNMQIELLLVVMNKSLGDGIEAPMLVKLLWFDPLFGESRMRFDNFSFIACDAMLAYFPNVKREIDERLATIHPEDVHSSKLAVEIVRTVTYVLVNAQLGNAPNYA
jgi:hypothetical protein